MNEASTQSQVETLKHQLEERSAAFRRSAFRWKLGYRTLLILSAVLSALTAVIASIPTIFDYPELAKDLSVLFPALVTVMSTVIASLNSENNWRANRSARHRVDMLLLDLDKSCLGPYAVRDDLKSIIQLRIDKSEKND